ncbi:MAG: glycine--tRNA ligase subunit beta [Burkholderiaceae bacterium]|nr:glycine--tRNA ligase subunit beta [Burkholderiaceae bacterium]
MPPDPRTQPSSGARGASPSSATRAALLVELRTEELPPKALERLGAAFADGLAKALRARGLIEADARVERFATPRRLAARIDAVATKANDRLVETKGPSVKIGLDATGEPTQALLKWAQKLGAPLDALERASDGKQEVFRYRSVAAGELLAHAISPVLAEAIAALPIPKTMQYQLADGRTNVSFVRPAHGLVVLHGAQVLEASVLGLAAGRVTRGHRFQSAGDIEIDDALRYEERLATAGRVVASFEARRARIESMLRERAARHDASLGDETQVATLLDEVNALVEWPAVYVGEFERAFLQVPQECLILTMRTNQKYFPLFDRSGRLLPKFLIVSNMEVDDARSIVSGNERVVRPRLADARFFFDMDRRTPLAQRVAGLGNVVYHAKLGTQAERTARVRRIARAVASMLDAGVASTPRVDVAPLRVDVELADRAALLAKADLLTGMVGEFPELQGVMGGYYARHDGEDEAVAQAIVEQYSPRFAGDALPATPTGTVLALADKLETLAGMFGIGQQPTGDKDPFALRRHALGVLRMLVEKSLAAPLDALVAAAFDAFGDEVARADALLIDFLFERLSGYLREQGWSAHEIAAVVDPRPMRLDTVPARLAAVRSFSGLPEAESLAAANKRIVNILRKSHEAAGGPVNRALLVEAAERALAECVDALAPQAEERARSGDWFGAMSVMAGAREAVDRFFDEVMVMADDAQLRANRLALLAALRTLMNRVADISKLG